MRDCELDALIAQSLKAFGSPEPPAETTPHHFSPAFEQRMRAVLGGTSPPRRRLRMRKLRYVLIAALIATLATSVSSAVASRSRHVQTFADSLGGYQTLGTEESVLENPELTYDLTALYARFSQGVEIRCGEQLTRFFHNAATGEFVEFSCYSKLVFRYRLSLPETELTPLDVADKEAFWFEDASGMGYVLWSTPSAVVVLRSNLSQEELQTLVERIHIFESA